MALKLELGKMRHVKSDEKTTTLMHPAGHTVTIIHSSLSPENQKALKALSGIAKTAATPLEADASKHQSNMKMADGGSISPAPSGQQDPAPKPPIKPIAKNQVDSVGGWSGALDNAAKEFGLKAEGGAVKAKQRFQNSPSGQNMMAQGGYTGGYASGQNPFPGGYAEGGGVKPSDKIKARRERELKQLELKHGANSSSLEVAKQTHRIANPELYAEGGNIKKQPKPENTIDYSQFKRKSPQQPGNTLDYKQLRQEYVQKNKPKYQAGGYATLSPTEKKANTVNYVNGEDSSTATPTRMPVAKPTYESSYGNESADRPYAHGAKQTPEEAADTHDHMDAEGGSVCYACGGKVRMYAEGTVNERVHAPGTYGGDKSYSQQDADVDKELEAGEQQAKRSIPQEINDEANDLQHNLKYDDSSLRRGSPQFQPPDPEKSIISPELGKVGNWLMQPSGAPDNQVTPVDVAATKADANVANLNQQQDNAQAVADATHQQATDQSQQQDPNSPQSLLEKGLAAETQGQQGQANALGTIAKTQAESMKQDIARKNDIASAHTNAFNELNNERQAHIQDIQNGYINPDLYWKGDAQGNGSHSKIAAGIGMVLAGFNPTNRPNAAIEFINHQLDRNLEAQKANLNSKNNLLQANLQQFHNLQDASDMTRIMQADVIKSQLQQDALKSGNPMAQAAAQSAIGQIDAKYQPLFMQLQMRKTMQSLGGGNTTTPGATGAALSTLDVMAPDAAKNYRERYYAPYDSPSGKSIADRPIPQNVREQINAQDILDNKGKDILGYISQHSGTWNPKTRAVAQQKVEEMKNFYNNSIQGGALTEGRLDWYDEQFKKHPTDILAQMMGNTDKLKEMVSSNVARKNTTLESYGLRPPKSAQQAQPQGNPMEGKTATNAQGKQIKMVNGRWVPVGQ